jgi:hypothetical protein
MSFREGGLDGAHSVFIAVSMTLPSHDPETFQAPDSQVATAFPIRFLGWLGTTGTVAPCG